MFDAPIEEHRRQANELFAALQAGEAGAAWRFKWTHPRFRDKLLSGVGDAQLNVADAEAVVAREHAFETWADLAEFVRSVRNDRAMFDFESAADAIVAGEIDALRALLSPELVRRRSPRRHHATLLHYIAANGVEQQRQRTPANALDVAKILLDAGTEPDALADMYDAKATTMNMLVSSSHPAAAGLQAALAELLLDYGADVNLQTPVLTALTFGYRDTAEMLAKRGASLDLPAFAGLGRIDDVRRTLPLANASSRHIALVLAAQHGFDAVVQVLLDAGEDPNCYNPAGYHAHSTPLHQAVAGGHANVVRLLIDRGARLDLRDALYLGTPLDWAIYLKQDAVRDLLQDG